MKNYPACRVKIPIITEADDKFYDTFIFRIKHSLIFDALKDQISHAVYFFFENNENEAQSLS